ncbi:MAG: hypothetical protein INR64_08170 [Caulobacteraceae bacterium]|nr:hypothetical protein [Caulobacter sp.]
MAAAIASVLRAPDDAGDFLVAAAFRCSPRPAFILDGDRRLRGLNGSAAALRVAAFANDHVGRLIIGRPDADAVMLQRLRLALGGAGPSGAALKLADGRLRGLLFHDLGDGEHVLMTVNLPFDERGCDVKVLGEAYGLTPAELRLLHLLLAGHPPKIAAGRVKASLHTVRTQIRSILLKSESPNLQVLLAKSSQLV